MGKLLWLPRALAAAVLLYVGWLKLIDNPTDVELFTLLGMEPQGRVIIGIIELAAGLLLLSPHAALGGLLAVGVMCGALIAHTTVLGFDPVHGGLLALVLLSSLCVLVMRRAELPIVGKTLGGKSHLL